LHNKMGRGGGVVKTDSVVVINFLKGLYKFISVLSYFVSDLGEM